MNSATTCYWTVTARPGELQVEMRLYRSPNREALSDSEAYVNSGPLLQKDRDESLLKPSGALVQALYIA